MTTPQISACAARLSERDRATFLAMLSSSAALYQAGTAMRLMAWAFYRDRTGRKKRDAQ